MQNSTVEAIYNALKCIFCDIKFQNFLGGDTPEPPYGRGSRATPSRTHPPDDLRRFAPPAVRRPLRGRLFGPIIPPPAISRSATGRSCLSGAVIVTIPAEKKFKQLPFSFSKPSPAPAHTDVSSDSSDRSAGSSAVGEWFSSILLKKTDHNYQSPHCSNKVWMLFDGLNCKLF